MAKSKRSRSKRRRGSGADERVEVVEAIEAVEEVQEVEETGAAADDDDAPKAQDADDDAKVDVPRRPRPATVSESEGTWNATRSRLTDDLLPFVSGASEEEGTIDALTSLLLEDDGEGSGRKRGEAMRRLLAASGQLFRYLERLGDMEGRLMEMERKRKLREGGLDEEDEEGGENEEDDDEEDGEPCALSGLPSLYTGKDGCDAGTDLAVDAETVWGQVELQNDALMPRLKKLIKRLGRRAGDEGGKYGEDDAVRVLAAPASEDDDDSEGGGSGEGESDASESEGSAASGSEEEGKEDDEEDDDDDEGDQAARRIRERMEAAMADMDADGESDDESDGQPNEDAERVDAEEGADPAREDMRDGFFDLHEMEAFADEEEEMLPEEAYGEEAVPDEEGDGDSDEGSDDDPLARRFRPTTVRRKKYRADDEVEALYKLYEDDGQHNNDDSDEEEGVVDPMAMTAADLFGKPSEKLIRSYKKKAKSRKNEGKNVITKKGGGAKEALSSFGDDDADSWDDHNFEEDGMDWKERGGDDGEEDNNSEEDPIDNNDDGEDGNIDEEEVHDDAPAEDNENLSSHMVKSQKLKEQTLALEKDLLSEKPWAMMGEAKGSDRGLDSLLDGGNDGGPTPEFAAAFKPPPILTEEHTTNIEEMIKKRIMEEDWDDVVPRELPDIGRRGKGADDAPEVSQEKSKLGLGELYEREFLKKKSGFDRDAHEKQTVEDAAKEEMKRLFCDLCSQLDALSNYQFAPRPVAEEVDVQNRDTSVIAMEEVLPLHVGKGRGVAPEEVYGGGETGSGKGAGKKGTVLKGESELDQAERKRRRAARKAARRKARKQKSADERLISKLQPGLGLNNPYEKRKLREELQMARASGKVTDGLEDEAAAGKEYQTSTKFFQKMQDNVDGILRGDEGDGRAKKKRKGTDEASRPSSVYRL